MSDDLEKELSAESEVENAVDQSSGEPEPQAPDEGAGEEASSPEGDAEISSEAEGDGEMPDLGPDLGDDNKVVNEGDASEDDAEEAMLKMLADLPQEDDKATPDDINFGTSVSDAEFQQLQQPVTSPSSKNIELLLDVDLPVSIELGRTKMSISDILGLGPGSVVELNKLAGEPVDLLVNNKVVAKGEVVVVDENFGLRITQLITPEERLKALAQE